MKKPFITIIHKVAVGLGIGMTVCIILFAQLIPSVISVTSAQGTTPPILPPTNTNTSTTPKPPTNSNTAPKPVPKPTSKPKPPTTTTGEDSCITLENQLRNGGFDVKSQLPYYCTTGSLYAKFINLALYAIGIAAVIAIIFGGYLYMTSGGNEEQRKKGRSVLTWAIIGLVVVILAAVLVNVIVKAVVENQFV